MDLFFRLLERRIQTLHLLSAVLRESQKALVEMDLNGIYQNTTQQENLCTGIHVIDRDLKLAQEKTPAAQTDAQSQMRLHSLAKELADAQAEVGYLNRVQTGLLRRLRRSVNVMVNFLANYSETYQAPGYGAARNFRRQGT